MKRKEADRGNANTEERFGAGGEAIV